MAKTKKKRVRTKDDLNKHETWFYNKVVKTHPHLAAKITFNDKAYVGTRYKSDLVIPLPHHDYLVGIVIEVQGGIFQGYGSKDGKRTGHASPQAIIRDCHKCMIAQNNRYFYLPVPTTASAFEAAIEFINDKYLDGVKLASGADGQKYDLDF